MCSQHDSADNIKGFGAEYSLNTAHINKTPTSKSVTHRGSEKYRTLTDMKSDEHNDSVVEELLSNRKELYQETFSPVSSSPIEYQRQQLSNQKRQKEQKRRNMAKQEKVLAHRGGLEKMEQFIMSGERSRELQVLGKQAEDNSIPPEIAEEIEKEQQEDLSDDDLIELLTNQSHWEQELELMLSDLTII